MRKVTIVMYSYDDPYEGVVNTIYAFGSRKAAEHHVSRLGDTIYNVEIITLGVY